MRSKLEMRHSSVNRNGVSLRCLPANSGTRRQCGKRFKHLLFPPLSSRVYALLEIALMTSVSASLVKVRKSSIKRATFHQVLDGSRIAGEGQSVSRVAMFLQSTLWRGKSQLDDHCPRGRTLYHAGAHCCSRRRCGYSIHQSEQSARVGASANRESDTQDD